MEEIKANEYVRTKGGYIARVKEIDNKAQAYWFDNCILKISGICCYDLHFEATNYIVKHSPNIINLIECGDYVNGYKVIDVLENLETGELHLEMPMDYTNEELGDCTVYNKDIKNIVTKEQYNQMKYIIKEDSNNEQ